MESKTTANPAAKTSKKQAPKRNEKGQLLPGSTANPNGRPLKGHSITETIKAMMDEKPEIKQALGSKVIQYALNGDMTAMKMLWQYIDGMPTQRNELTGKDGQPIQVETFTDLIRQAITHDADPDNHPPTRQPGT